MYALHKGKFVFHTSLQVLLSFVQMKGQQTNVIYVGISTPNKKRAYMRMIPKTFHQEKYLTACSYVPIILLTLLKNNSYFAIKNHI